MRRRYSHAKKPVLLHGLPGRRYRWGTTEDEHMKLVRDVRKAWKNYFESTSEGRTAWKDGKCPTMWKTAELLQKAEAAGLLQKANPEYRTVERKHLARMINKHFKRRLWITK
jgi:hypothetical protein